MLLLIEGRQMVKGLHDWFSFPIHISSSFCLFKFDIFEFFQNGTSSPSGGESDAWLSVASVGAASVSEIFPCQSSTSFFQSIFLSTTFPFESIPVQTAQKSG